MNCIDSDFAIAILKGNSEAKELLDELESQGEIFITSISVFEVTYTSRGISRKKEETLMNFLDTLKVLPLGKRTALVASKIGTQLVKEGKMLHPMDLLIGAVALQNNMPLVTNNKKHFSRIEGLEIICW
ncbi:MAG: type II toxin-antitoxin system VapC family toxin [Candidatus Thermoplasmatota archaeon]|nr:type II toxin-antitoxin system VapC family toxin [Candidatus Thermoplasmatota archaeon]